MDRRLERIAERRERENREGAEHAGRMLERMETKKAAVATAEVGQSVEYKSHRTGEWAVGTVERVIRKHEAHGLTFEEVEAESTYGDEVDADEMAEWTKVVAVVVDGERGVEIR